ncbi:MAG: V-type ATP synthase subunit F [Actinomycetota bacterium]|nr:V-type ATP synthase subunit F [Actinomycetota bacterium]
MKEQECACELGVAMVGGKTSTIGFRALGVDTYTVVHPDNAEEIWEEVPLEKYAVVFITEPIYERVAQRIADFREEGSRLPVITVLPSVAVSEERGIMEIKDKVEKAVGLDIFET